MTSVRATAAQSLERAASIVDSVRAAIIYNDDRDLAGRVMAARDELIELAGALRARDAGWGDVLRDATPRELVEEPDAVLQGLVDGSIEATPATRERAKAELAVRRLR